MQTRFLTSMDTLAANLRPALQPYLDDPHFPAMLTAAQAETVKQTCGLDDDQLAGALLPLAAACALTPISHFNVGALVRGKSGHLYFGANIEFPGAPLQQTVHAEQCAITHAWLSGESGLTAIYVNHTPCGHCRQFMNELHDGASLPIHLPGRPLRNLADYLPDAFGPGDLGITHFLMDKQDHDYRLSHADSLTQAALKAARQSHAPYSQSHSGVALETVTGAIYSGRYAENAAFNPSMAPLQAALIMMNMSGCNFQEIHRVVLVETADTAVSQWDATRTLLNALGCQDINRLCCILTS